MEAIVSNIVGGFLANLGSEAVKALLQEVKQVKSVHQEVRRLEDALSTINPVLLDAEEKQAKDRQIKVWLQKLREVMYDADDLLDEFFTTIRQSRVISNRNLKAQVRIFFSKKNPLWYNVKMSRELKDINQRLDDVAKSRQFHLEPKSPAGTRKREPSHSVKPILFIGRERDEEKIINLLLQSDNKKKVSTIAIVGYGGMGKTALVQKVFNDDNVAKSFELKMWTCVSEDFDLRVIIKKILGSATKGKVEELEMDTLVSQLKSKIDGKKYMLILDDIWNDDRERWCHLEALLAGGAQGSKILVTTRMRTVADAVGSTTVHDLKGLSEEDSWSLFQKTAFEEGEEMKNQNLVDIGRRIAKKCYGVPLVIRAIGSMLYRNYSERQWRILEKEEISRIDQEIDVVMPSLRLSYNHLPSHLKSCFVCCASFPKDCWIEVITLVQLWMARGLVQSSEKECCLIEVGLRYFTELLQRCFFQEGRLNEWGEVQECKMHDLMHDLATSIAGDECKTFNSATNDIAEGVRHVSFDYEVNSTWKVPDQLAQARRLQTFFFPSHRGWSSRAWGEAILKDVCSKFKYIRVLDLHRMAMESVSDSIGSLKHLRYLDLSDNKDIKFLPESLTMLVNLKTLKLNWCQELQCLPRHFKQLVNLRHLEIEECSKLVCMPSGLGQLLFLEILPRFVVCKDQKLKDYSHLSELSKLNNLTGMLQIEGLGHGRLDKLDFDAANLKEKKGLQALALIWDRVGCSERDEIYDENMVEGLPVLSNLKNLVIKGYVGVKFPEWMKQDMASHFQNLVKLELWDCGCKQLPLMELFPCLNSLWLINLGEVEYIDQGTNVRSRNATFFPSLKILRLQGLPKLKGWWREEVTDQTVPFFPCLSSLAILYCENLRSMPPQPHLNRLEIRGANIEMLKKELTSAKIWKAETETSSSSSATSSLVTPSKLEKLDIAGIKDVEALTDECSQNLTSLKRLFIADFNNRKSIPNFGALTSLNTLSINYDMDNVMPLKNLSQLFIEGMGDVSLPSSLPNVTTLQTLQISGMPNLESLPDLPSSLQRLFIKSCPKLKERVRKSEGEDWPKISHIPFISSDGIVIQYMRGTDRLNVQSESLIQSILRISMFTFFIGNASFAL